MKASKIITIAIFATYMGTSAFAAKAKEQKVKIEIVNRPGTWN